MKKLLTLISLFMLMTGIQAQTTLISYSFPTGTPADSLPTLATAANAALAIRTEGGTSTINYSTNGLTNFSAQVTGWENGMNVKSWYFRFYTQGYQNIRLSGIVRSGGNNPGPRDFSVQYRIVPSGVWIDVPGTTISCGNNWTSGVLSNVDLPADINNQTAMIELRWVMTSNTNANGGTVVTTGISKMDNVLITGDQVIETLSGTVTYNNTAATPLANVIISLENSDFVPVTATTDSQGHYSFPNLAPGTYQVTLSSTAPWGGVNSTDALMILNHFVGNTTLTGLNAMAADVNNSVYINAADALDVTKRFVNMMNSFALQDWIFETATVVIPASGVVVKDLKGICAGDVNASYNP